MTEGADVKDLFSRAIRLGDLEKVAGVKLHRGGKRLRGECPLCRASAGKKADGAFSADPRTKKWNCFACDEKGDVIDLEAKLARCSLREAAERLAGVSLETGPPDRRPVDPAPAARRVEAAPKKAAWIDQVIREARPAWGTPVAAYLSGRGIDGSRENAFNRGLVNEALKDGGLLFHPRVPYAWNSQAHSWDYCPAMVLRVQTASGFTGGVHCTYLARTGPLKTWSKAPITPAKRMWGPQNDADGRPGGCWLIKPYGVAPAVVAEGVESALSAALLFGRPCRVLATLSLGRLQGGWLQDKYGRVNADVIAADPDKPAMTWPGVAEVVIAVDRDMGPITIKARKATGGTYQRTLAADERARICAGLAEQSWRRAGANRVHTIAPAAGRDFNDELRASAA